jgi:hypothetical protein
MYPFVTSVSKRNVTVVVAAADADDRLAPDLQVLGADRPFAEGAAPLTEQPVRGQLGEDAVVKANPL